MPSNFDEKYNNYLQIFNAELDKAFNSLNNLPKILKDAMVYAVTGGGKRIRPVLCIAVADMLGVDVNRALPFAIAIECIHSYSLVHDDLPAMDNDDFRRGKPSTHKQFGEAYGILAGDALLNFAFEYCLNKTDFGAKDALALKILAEYAGPTGMIGGQVLDLENEKKSSYNEDVLYSIYLNKTAKLLTAPLLISSELAGGKYKSILKEFGLNFGYMFQITDDIMDVEGTIELIGKTPNKDVAEDKLTAIKVYGLNGAKNKNKILYNKCIELLKKINGSEFLQEFTTKIYTRNK